MGYARFLDAMVGHPFIMIAKVNKIDRKGHVLLINPVTEKGTRFRDHIWLLRENYVLKGRLDYYLNKKVKLEVVPFRPSDKHTAIEVLRIIPMH